MPRPLRAQSSRPGASSLVAQRQRLSPNQKEDFDDRSDQTLPNVRLSVESTPNRSPAPAAAPGSRGVGGSCTDRQSYSVSAAQLEPRVGAGVAAQGRARADPGRAQGVALVQPFLSKAPGKGEGGSNGEGTRKPEPTQPARAPDEPRAARHAACPPYT